MYATSPITHASELSFRQRSYSLSKNLGDLRKLNNRSTSSVLESTDTTAPSEKELITYIFPDFSAAEYFQKDFAMLNEFHVMEESEAVGFEIYLVDQWVRHRKIGTVVSVYNGNYESKVKVVKFTIRKMPIKRYPPRFQEYLNEMILNHAAFKKMNSVSKEQSNSADTGETVGEFLLVTNIAVLPSNVNLVAIANGDVREIKSTFYINSNLKKLNCAGRSLSLTMEKVSDASEDKFRQMYRIFNSSVPIRFAICELVNLIQTCLFYYDLLDARYCDGLLCQKTEDAINNWWNLIGLPHFNAKPNPRIGILPSKTVAAIISLTVSVKMRLHIFGGCDVPKDPFDFENFMISIGQFQKQVKLEKKRKLNLITLLRLFYYTNQKLPSDNTKQYGGFGSDLSLTEGSFNDITDNLSTSKHNYSYSSLHNDPTASALTASAYRRNKLYYSKELKKLTNVVKNTVQDHIIVREDNDGFHNEPSKTGSKLRNKIASKLTELITPNDVETTDLDILVRKFLVGKTLLRLWKGLPKSADSTSFTVDDKLLHQHHDHHGASRHKRPRSYDFSHPTGIAEDSRYQFISLKDAIVMNQELSSLHSEKASGRLGRMKFAFQGRRSNPIYEIDAYSSNTGQFKSKSYSSGDQVESVILEANECKNAPEDNTKSKPCTSEKLKEDFRGLMTRRSSFPILYNGVDVNITTAETLQIKPPDVKSLRKCASFSVVEDYFHCNDELYSKGKMKVDYLDDVLDLIKLENYKKNTNVSGTVKVARHYKQINYELVKLHGIHNRMQNKRLVINSEYSSVLAGRMKDLTDNIDRMAFRCRDLTKKINELEENSKIFNFKLQDTCVGKLDGVIGGLIKSSKFLLVFNDEEERKKLIFDLSGKEYVEESNGETENSYFGLRSLAIFLYELFIFFLHFFDFDRSKMNLERIRRSYKMVDPNRRYIDRAYTFVRRDSAPLDTAMSPNAPNSEEMNNS